MFVNLDTRCSAFEPLQVYYEGPWCSPDAHTLVDIGNALSTMAAGVRVHGHGLSPCKVLQAVLDTGHVVAVVEEVKGDVQEGIISLRAPMANRTTDIALQDTSKESVHDAIAIVLGATEGSMQTGAKAQEEFVGVLLLVARHFSC